MAFNKALIGLLLVSVCIGTAAATAANFDALLGPLCDELKTAIQGIDDPVIAGLVAVLGLNCDCVDAKGDLDYCKDTKTTYRSRWGSNGFFSGITGTILGGLSGDSVVTDKFDVTKGLVGMVDTAAKETVNAINNSGIVVNVSECADAIGKLLCHFGLYALECENDRSQLCKDTCELFVQKCVVDLAGTALKEVPKRICNEAGVGSSICDIDFIGMAIIAFDINVCDDLPSDNCVDLNLRQPLTNLKDADRGVDPIIFVLIGCVAVLAVLAGALWYRQRSSMAAVGGYDGKSDASSDFGGALSTGTAMTQASGKTRGSSAGRRSGGSRTSAGRSSGSGLSNNSNWTRRTSGSGGTRSGGTRKTSRGTRR